MKEYLNFTVGPVMSDDAVRSIGAEQVPYFRTPEFSEVMLQSERLMLQFTHAPEGSRVAFMTGSGTASTQPVFHYYTQDHLGNNRAVVNQSGTVEQITHYYPFGGFFADAGTNSSLQPYKYNGKELDYDYGFRQYDPVVPMFTQADPMAEKYYHLSPYVYCGNNPVMFIDENGDSTRVYVETNQLGHAWLSVGEGKDMVVYSYGRYNGTYKGNQLSNGDGVLLRLTDDKAKNYIDKKKVEGMNTFVITDVNDKKVKEYVDNLFNSSTRLPDEKSKEYNNDSSAHIIDSYNLLSNNCTTLYLMF